jgi:sortase A
MSIQSIVRICSSVFLLVGACLLIGDGFVVVQAHVFQAREAQRLASLPAGAKLLTETRRAHESGVLELAREPGSVVGELEIPRVGIHTIILEGDDSRNLRRGAGHIPETAMPEDPGGNVGIAAHRDTYFRSLRFIGAGDLIVIRTPAGSYQYRVQFSRIVEPSDVAVLDSTAHRTLTLVTCYPFYFVGPAPRRFIVRATAVE